jgi:hypothetical protein
MPTASFDPPGIEDAIRYLAEAAFKPLRLRDVDSRLYRLGDIEDEFAINADDAEDLSPRMLVLLEKLFALWESERDRLRHAHTDAQVIADAWQELKDSRAQIYPKSGYADESEVILVMRGEPDWGLFSVILPSVTLAPSDRRHWTYSLLGLPGWLYSMLLEHVATHPSPHADPHTILSSPLVGVGPEEREVLIGLWDDRPDSELFDLPTTLATARMLLAS